MADPVASNNSASDADTVRRALPTLTLLDNFNRANANSLGANWSQANTGANVDIRVNANQAFANQNNDGAQAMWNVPTRRRLRCEPGCVDGARDDRRRQQPR